MAKLRTDIASKTVAHKQSMMSKQEVLQQTLNESTTASSSRSSPKKGVSPKKGLGDPIQTLRDNQLGVCKDKDQVKDSLREFNRQIPILAADFQFEVE